jgi:hypothetical protein
MIPGRIIVQADLPINKNGKILNKLPFLTDAVGGDDAL